MLNKTELLVDQNIVETVNLIPSGWYKRNEIEQALISVNFVWSEKFSKLLINILIYLLSCFHLINLI